LVGPVKENNLVRRSNETVRWLGASHMGHTRNAQKVLVEKPEGKRMLG
jgi:hypothetical protein